MRRDELILVENASVLSALTAWLIHAGKKVEGADSCTICMMLVAPTTKQLPKVRIRNRGEREGESFITGTMSYVS